MKLRASITAFIFTVSVVSGCSSSSQNSASVAVPTKSITAAETAGVYQSAVKVSATETQEVSLAGGSLSGSKISFPPGSLSTAMLLSIEEDSSLADDQEISSLVVSNPEPLSAAIAILPDVKANPAMPFTINLAVISSNLLLAGIDTTRLAILYAAVDYDEDGAIKKGVLPPSYVTYSEGRVSFSVSLFGSYQLVLTAEPVTKVQEITSTAEPVVTTSTSTSPSTSTSSSDTGTVVALTAPVAFARPGFQANSITAESVAGATQYDVYWSATPGVTTSSTKISNVTLPYMHSTLTNGTTYYYKVAAVASGQDPALSTEFSAQPGGLAGPICADNDMQAFASDGNITYVGGYFTRVGPCASGNAVALDTSTADRSFVLPEISGSIYTVAADGSGGWYIGGWFYAVGGQTRNNLAHIDSLGQLTAFDPNVDSAVHTIALSGTTLYVGGEFTQIGSSARSSIGAINTMSGLATTWDPGADAAVKVLQVSGTDIYAVGEFTQIGSQSITRLAKLSTASNTADATFNPNPDATVRTIALTGSTLYVGGSFANIGGSARNNLAAIDTSTGQASSWNPDPDGSVSAIGLYGSDVYIAGSFLNIGASARNRLAAIDASGSVTSWAPVPDGDVLTLVISGTNVYVGGSFTDLSGNARNRLASIGVAGTGTVSAWDPNVGRPADFTRYADVVSSVAVSGSTAFAMGTFTLTNAVTRNYLAAFDRSGNLTAWNPSANNFVRTLALNGPYIYVSGDFTTLGGSGRTYVGRTATDGSLSTWNPDADGTVYSFVFSGSTIYAGGAFTSIGGASRANLAALDSNGTATSWAPEANGEIRSMVQSGSTLYMGGSFTTLGGQTRNRLAAVNFDGTLQSWNPNANNMVYSLALSGSTIYAGGNFTQIGTTARNYLTAVTTGGTLTPWDPSANSLVTGLAVSGTNVYATGCFTTLGGQSHTFVGAVDAAGASTGWDPGGGINCGHNIYAFGSTLYVASPLHSSYGFIRNPGAVDATTAIPVW